MIQQIDGARRLSPEAHYALYCYYQGLVRRRVPYSAFNITEQLIDRYNAASPAEKQAVADRMDRDPAYPQFLEHFRRAPWKLEKPVLWGDREKTDYFIQQLTQSHAFEVYIDWLFRGYGVDIGLYYGREQQYRLGETAVGIEIKFDKRSADTGNYYIEYQERMRDGGPWVDSGIRKPDATSCYLLGTIGQFVILRRDWLMTYYHRLVERGETLPDARLVQERTHKTSKGFILLPAAWRRGSIPLETLIAELSR